MLGSSNTTSWFLLLLNQIWIRSTGHNYLLLWWYCIMIAYTAVTQWSVSLMRRFYNYLILLMCSHSSNKIIIIRLKTMSFCVWVHIFTGFVSCLLWVVTVCGLPLLFYLTISHNFNIYLYDFYYFYYYFKHHNLHKFINNILFLIFCTILL